MNICKTGMKHILLTVLVVICCHNEIFSQWTRNSRDRKPGLFVGFNLGPSQTQIINEGTLSGSGLLSKKMNAFSGSTEIGYFFSKYIGISSGIGFDSYKTQLTLPSWQNAFNAVDSENETYEKRVSATDINEVQNIGYLSVPICLNLRVPFSEKAGFFLQGGISMGFPLIKNYTTSGVFTYKGYYPAYNVLLEDLPDYGFASNVNSEIKGDLELKSSNTNAIASVGFDFFLQPKILIGIGAFYSKSLSNISAYTSPETFRLSSDVDQVNSLMGGSSKVSPQSMGVKICLRYYLKY